MHEIVIVMRGEDEVAGLAEAMAEFGRKHGLTEEAVSDAQLVLEEVVVNSICHGFTEEGDHRVEVRIALTGGDLILTTLDDGIPFNPLDAPPADVDAPIEDRPIGGLGIHLVRNLMDSVTYERTDDGNRLVMRKSLG